MHHVNLYQDEHTTCINYLPTGTGWLLRYSLWEWSNSVVDGLKASYNRPNVSNTVDQRAHIQLHVRSKKKQYVKSLTPRFEGGRTPHESLEADWLRHWITWVCPMLVLDGADSLQNVPRPMRPEATSSILKTISTLLSIKTKKRKTREKYSLRKGESW